MKIKTLEGAALDWAVAKCEGVSMIGHQGFVWDAYNNLAAFEPSINWAQAGPIIERERITLAYGEDEKDWFACIGDSRRFDNDTPDGLEKVVGPTPLLAAMRCYVASNLGDEVEIPEELK
jgi:hypothetical protein